MPYELAFDDDEIPPTEDYGGMALNIIFGLDLIFTLNTAIADPDVPDAYITDRRFIVSKYLTGW